MQKIKPLRGSPKLSLDVYQMSRDMRFPKMWYVRPAKAQTSLRIRADWSELLPESSMTVKLLTKQHLEVLCLKGGCTGLSESTYVKMPHCWKSHAMAQMVFNSIRNQSLVFSLSDLLAYMILNGPSTLYCINIWASIQQKVQFGMCAHRRLRSACLQSTVAQLVD